MFTLIAFLLVILSSCEGNFGPLGNALLQSKSVLSLVQPADCVPPPIEGLILTDKEQELLKDICWKDSWNNATNLLKAERGIPEGVICTAVQWCDGDGMCSTVCERGSVQLEPWFSNAVRTQTRLSQQLPFCYATFLGTHNSAISLADGYGNLDPYFQSYFQYVSWVDSDAYLETHNQVLSLTDQMNMGVRSIELDTHWVEGELRIAHCGGFHEVVLNLLVDAVNLVARLLGHSIHWDTETVGCEPSLSSIPAAEQRTFVDALMEISAWMDLPENSNEFLILYLDDQMDLSTWGLLPRLLSQIQEVFPLAMLYTPPDHAQRSTGDWPTAQSLVDAGKRIVWLSGVDYGPAMADVIFSKGGLCSWQEPGLAMWEGEPACMMHADGLADGGETLSGQILRTTTCELQYGPMNCEFVWKGTNEPLLTEETMPSVARCGLNQPCPDALIPERAEAVIWTWAPGHPASPASGGSASTASWPALAWRTLSLLLRQLGLPIGPLDDQALCAAVSGEDGRWRAVSCSEDLPTACRDASQAWVLASGGRGQCPAGTAFSTPRHSKENLALQSTLQSSGLAAAFLPITGPKWEVGVARESVP